MLRPLLPVDDPRVLVDAATRDDAAVYRIAENRALVVTVDFFAPLVDDPFDFGRIAAANALSDVYAMGGKPLFALNLLSFPRDLLDQGIVEEIVRGGADKAAEAGVPVLGGHSIDDPEPKYGMVAVGEVDPAHMLANDRARPGDRLVLTKPLGTGVVATAAKKEACPPEVLAGAVESMARLNRAASEAALAAGARAATDVTGYGLAGHLLAMARASGTSATIDSAEVPLLEGVAALAEAGHMPGGSRRNLADVAPSVSYAATPATTRLLLSDAQTSGGLLLACPPDRLPALEDELAARDVPCAEIGTMESGPRPGESRPRIEVTQGGVQEAGP